MIHYAAMDGPNALATEDYSKAKGNSDPNYYSFAVEIGPETIDIDTCIALDGLKAPVNDILPFVGFQGYDFSGLNFGGQSYAQPYVFRTAVVNGPLGSTYMPNGCKSFSANPLSLPAYNCLLGKANSEMQGIARGFPTFTSDSDPAFATFMSNVSVNNTMVPIVTSGSMTPFFNGGLSGFEAPSPFLCDFFSTNESNLDC
jgi:hypothetical protein